MEEVVRKPESEEPAAFGHQQTEDLPFSAALREKSASEPDERAGCPGARDKDRGRAAEVEGTG